MARASVKMLLLYIFSSNRKVVSAEPTEKAAVSRDGGVSKWSDQNGQGQGHVTGGCREPRSQISP